MCTGATDVAAGRCVFVELSTTRGRFPAQPCLHRRPGKHCLRSLYGCITWPTDSQRHVRLRVCSHRPESTTTTVVTYLTVTAVDRRSRRSWPSWGRSDTIPVCIHRFERKPESVVFWMLCPVIHVGKNAVVFTSSPAARRACDIAQSDDPNRSSLLGRGPTIWCQIEARKESDDSSTHCGCWVCGVFIVPPLWLRNLVPDLDL